MKINKTEKLEQTVYIPPLLAKNIKSALLLFKTHFFYNCKTIVTTACLFKLFHHISFIYIKCLGCVVLCKYGIILGKFNLYFAEVKEIVEPSPDEVVEEFLQNRGPAEEPVEREKEKTDEEEYQELLDEEHALKLKEEELLAIGIAGWMTCACLKMS